VTLTLQQMRGTNNGPWTLTAVARQQQEFVKVKHVGHVRRFETGPSGREYVFMPGQVLDDVLREDWDYLKTLHIRGGGCGCGSVSSDFYHYVEA